ncbi:MAG: hypothetical protein Q4A72_04975 [Bacillota bacterium]|nr:hypothetical protein [Bacillota bacterium]
MLIRKYEGVETGFMAIDRVKIKVMELEERLHVTFPKRYFEFLCSIDDGDVFEVNH